MLALAALACNVASFPDFVQRFNQRFGPQPLPATPEPETPGIPPTATPADGLPTFDGGDGLMTALVQPIEIGERVEGAFDTTSDAHNWVFEGREGVTITAYTELPEDAETDPRLALLGPDGKVLAASDDDEGYNPVITFTLPADGEYTLRATTWWPGPYTLTLAEE